MVRMVREQSSSQAGNGLHQYLCPTKILVDRALRVCLLGMVLILGASCGALEPLDEPEVTDLQLTVDTLKASVRDAQRTASELRNELEASRQSLAEAQVARAQLEGRVREAERRLGESKQVIDLQREELASARTERERLSRSSLLMQSQLKQLQKQLPKFGKAGEGGQPTGVSPANSPLGKPHQAMVVPAPTNSPLRTMPERNIPVPPTTLVRMPQMGDSSSERGRADHESRYVTVTAGDTLWRIAHRYHVDVDRLRVTNQLADNLIEVGQALRLPEGRTEGERATPVP